MITKVKSELDLRAVRNSKWKLLAPYVVEIDGIIWTVPEDFYTDLSSLPRPLRIFFSGTSLDRWAAVLHDYFCVNGYDRFWSALVFRQMLKDLGASTHKAYAFYIALWLHAYYLSLRRKYGKE